jgi:hypothetical protein
VKKLNLALCAYLKILWCVAWQDQEARLLILRSKKRVRTEDPDQPISSSGHIVLFEEQSEKVWAL